MTDDAETIGEHAATLRKFTVRNYLDGAKAKADLSYTLTNLSDAFQAQGGFRLEYATYAAQASKQVDDLKMILEATESAVYRKLRDEATARGEKITETYLEKMVIGTDRVLALKRAINEAKQIEAIAKGAVEGFKDRKDMLVQEGASNRQEREGELRMTGIRNRDDATEAVKRRVLEGLQDKTTTQ